VLNWLSRYGFVIQSRNRLRRRRRLLRPILDVGSGPYGIGFWTGEPFVGVDLNFEAAPHPANFALLADAAALPFADAAFEEVVLADLLEHVPPERRPAVLSEALRVAARRVYITFPTGEAARRADRIFADYHRRVFGTVPGWVSEHEAHPLPTPEEVAALLSPLKAGGQVKLKIVPGENARFHLLLTLADHLPAGFSKALSEGAKADLSDWLRVFRAAAVGTPYRVNFVVELSGRPEPLLKKLSAEPDLFAVLACPVCRCGLIPEPETLRCPRCRRAYRRGGQGVLWDLRPAAGMQAPAPRPIPTPAVPGAVRCPDGPAPRPFLSVVIATYNRPADLERCLDSLAAAAGGVRRRQFEVVVVDDGSDPAEAAENRRLAASYRRQLQLRFIRQAHRGPAAARNRGIRAARGHVLLFLNDDVTVPPESLKAHIEFHREHPELWVGMLGRVEWAPELGPAPIMDYVMGAGGHQFDFKKLAPGREVDFWHFYGTCLSVKRRFVLETGELFDPDFLALWDDIEWGYRLSARGLKVYYRPEAVVFHHHRVDTDYYVRRQRLAGRTAVVFARKHPELAPRLLGAGGAPAPDAAEAGVEALRAQAGLLERAVGENPELKPVLEDAYGRLLAAAYRQGAAEGLKECPVPSAGELIRRAENAVAAEAATRRPEAAFRLLKPLKYGPPEVRVLYRLAGVLAGRGPGELCLPPAPALYALRPRLARAPGPPAPALPAGTQPALGPGGPEADEYAWALYWLLKLGLFEEFERVFFLAGEFWPGDRERARALARIAARAGRWEAAAALLEELKTSGKAAEEDLELLSRAYIEFGLAEADGILQKVAHANA